MNIQQSLNQTFSIAGFLYQQSEFGKQKVEEAQIAKDIEAYEKAGDFGENPSTGGEAAVQTNIAERGVAAYKRQFYMKPSEKTYKMYKAAEEDYFNLTTNPYNAYAIDAEEMQEKANDRATAAKKAEEDRVAATQLETQRLSTLSDWPQRIANKKEV